MNVFFDKTFGKTLCIDDKVYDVENCNDILLYGNNEYLIQWINNKGYHRLDGPARVITGRKMNEYFINGKDITYEVHDWMEENNITYPFGEEEKVLFKLRFA